MKLMYKIGLSVLILIYSSAGLAKGCKSDCKSEQIQLYFSAIDEVSRDGSNVNDIESLLALTHDDVKYIHLEYEANFNKDAWRKAFMRNLERGAYKNGPDNEIRILNTIYGKNHVAIEYSHGVKVDGTWQKSELLLALFGFTDGKISFIKEYW